MPYLSEFQSNEDIAIQYANSCSSHFEEQKREILDTLNNSIVHLAWYGSASYSGSSLVILEKDGKLYEVNGSHCSCSGLEGQWDLEETDWQAIKMRDFDSFLYEGSKEAHDIIQKLCDEHINKREPQ